MPPAVAPIKGIVTIEELAPALDAMYDNGITRGVHPGWDTLAEYYLAQEGQLTIVGGLPSHGKALALDTPIPTTTGWATMGTICVGDRVFDEHGDPCVVTHATEVMEGHSCYKMEFADGTIVICDADHEWVTWDIKTCKSYDYAHPRENAYPLNWPSWEPCRSSSAPYTAQERAAIATYRSQGFSARMIGEMLGRTANAIQQQWHKTAYTSKAVHPRTTKDISQTLLAGGQHNHSIPGAGPLMMDEAPLPLDPYVLGILLGDGDTAGGGRVACHPQDKYLLMDIIKSCGFHVSPCADEGHFYIAGIHDIWKSLGLCAGKFIPSIYLRASASQRLALAQGLIDSDGGVDNHRAYRFSNTNEALIEGFHELLCSLGHIPRVAFRKGRLRNMTLCKDNFDVIVPGLEHLSRLPRKFAHARHAWKREQSGRSIVRCDPCSSVPVRCIKVSSPSSLYLCTRAMIPTHNTRFISNMMLNIIQRHGWKFAAFSPESRPERFVKLLLEQYTGKCFDQVPDRWRYVQPGIERMTWPEMSEARAWLHAHFTMITPDFAHSTVPGMLELARRQVEVEGIKGVIFDPWSWVVKSPGRGQMLTDYVAEQLVTIKNFCTQYDTHLWLIAHPTKLRVAERGPYAGLYAPPTLYDTSGSAHFYNTADMGLCVWRNTETNAPETEIHIQKVRFEENGMTGKIELFYDKYTKRYYDMGTEPVRTYAGY